jgi:hypothetical protein
MELADATDVLRVERIQHQQLTCFLHAICVTPMRLFLCDVFK